MGWKEGIHQSLIPECDYNCCYYYPNATLKCFPGFVPFMRLNMSLENTTD